VFTFLFGVGVTYLWIHVHRERAERPKTINLVSETRIDPHWVYINRDIEWESPPKQIQQTFQASLNSTIVIFFPSGRYASVGCTLYRDNKSQRMAISAGDDFVVAQGTWKRNDDGIITTDSKVTYGMLRNASSKSERWAIVEPSADQIANVLQVNGRSYVPIPNVGNFEQLSPMIGTGPY
jgi:hypothetical protein